MKTVGLERNETHLLLVCAVEVSSPGNNEHDSNRQMVDLAELVKS
jgi:hypothetical protein